MCALERLKVSENGNGSLGRVGGTPDLGTETPLTPAMNQNLSLQPRAPQPAAAVSPCRGEVITAASGTDFGPRGSAEPHTGSGRWM